MRSAQLDDKRLSLLREKLRKMNAREIDVKSPHEIYRFDDKDKGLFMVAYKSGKLVYREGAHANAIIQALTVKEDEGFDYILGTDEAGKGEWYGPLVVACAALTPEHIKKADSMGVQDSKKLARRRIDHLASKIKSAGIPYRVVVLHPQTYNRMYAEFRSEGKNLNHLLAWSHSRVVKDLLTGLEYDKAKIIIDLFDRKRMEERLGGIPGEHITLVQKSGAESETPVACASIIAKSAYESEVDKLESAHGIRLRDSAPKDVPEKLLPKVAKMHFKNVSRHAADRTGKS